MASETSEPERCQFVATGVFPPPTAADLKAELVARDAARERIDGVDPTLLWLLRRAGDEWGPLGVAKVAARLAEHHVVPNASPAERVADLEAKLERIRGDR